MSVKSTSGVFQRLLAKTLRIDNPIETTYGVGVKSTLASVRVTELGDGILHKTKLTFTDTPITLADDANVAQYGGLKIYDFPEGMLCTLGGVIDGVLENDGTATIIDTFTGVIGLGTATAGTGTTLTGTEADILQSTALTQAVAGIANCDAQSAATALTEAGARWFDGTGTAKDMYLNVAIADDATHTAGTILFTGTVELVWLMLGDN